MRKSKLLLAAMMAVATGTTAQNLPYQNPNLPAEERAEDLLGRLTLEEKAKLMMNGSPAIERLGIPQFDWWSEALHGVGRNGLSTTFPSCIGMAASFLLLSAPAMGPIILKTYPCQLLQSTLKPRFAP